MSYQRTLKNHLTVQAEITLQIFQFLIQTF